MTEVTEAPVPGKVKVGPVDYTVKVRRMEMMGETISSKARIELSKNQSEGQRRETLMHEVLHAVVYMSGYAKVGKLSHDAEERLVVMLSPWLTAFLRDNPEAVSYLTSE